MARALTVFLSIAVALLAGALWLGIMGQVGERRDAIAEANRLSDDARALFEQGRYDEAEPLYRRSLDIRERSLGAGHPDVAESLDEIAALDEATGRDDDAEALYKRSLAIREKALGPDHPEVGDTLRSLAELYRNQGRFQSPGRPGRGPARWPPATWQRRGVRPLSRAADRACAPRRRRRSRHGIGSQF